MGCSANCTSVSLTNRSNLSCPLSQNTGFGGGDPVQLAFENIKGAGKPVVVAGRVRIVRVKWKIKLDLLVAPLRGNNMTIFVLGKAQGILFELQRYFCSRGIQ